MEILSAIYKGKTVYIVGVLIPLGMAFCSYNGEQLNKFSVKLSDLENITVVKKP